MGEKEQGAARESSSPSISEREASTGLATGRESMTGRATGREGGISHEDDWHDQRAAATGEVGDDGPPESAINNAHSGVKNLQGPSATADDGTDHGSASAESGIIKSKSNITNNREGVAGGSAGDGIAIGDPGVNGN